MEDGVKKTLGVVGCGWLGSRLVPRLSDKFIINLSTRTKERAEKLAARGYPSIAVEFSDEKDMPLDRWEAIPSLEVLVVSVPFSIRRATPDSLRFKMNNLCRFIGDFDGQLFFTSSTGVLS